MFEVRGTVGRYQLVKAIGRCAGVSGVVYLAVDPDTRQRVALKVIRTPPGRDTSEVVSAERAGARLQQRLALRTTMVPPVHECRHADGVFYIAMQYIEGEDLDRRIGNGRRLVPELAARVMRDICACLAVAHAPHHLIDGVPRSIVHGDLKPGNIRLTPSGAVKILDFGTARPISPAGRCWSHGTYLTLEYASPERIATGCADAGSDLWAVGVMLHEALAGRRPWEGMGAAAPRAIGSTTPPPMLPSSCPVQLAGIAARALAFRPEDRYRSAAEMRGALDAFLTVTDDVMRRCS